MLDGRLKEHILFKMVLRISQNFSKYGLKGYHFILRDLDIHSQKAEFKSGARRCTSVFFNKIGAN